MSNSCVVSVSIGELWDKYTILLIKKEKIVDTQKLMYVEKEIEYLTPFIEKYNLDENIQNELKECNTMLWNIEDKIREKEYEKEFDQEFIELARSVYYTNDSRAEIKKKINQVFQSSIFEVKSYKNYKM